MIENEFVVPDRTEDLCEISTSQYVVNDVSSVRDLTAEIKTFEVLLSEEGDEFIFRHFDTFYSLLRQFSETEEDIRRTAYEALLEVGGRLIKDLPYVLDNNDEMSDSNVRFKYRNLIKMAVYLLCQLAEAYESELLKPSIVVTEKVKGRKKKKKSFESGWDTVRNDFVSTLVQLYKLPLHKFWEPPVMEHEFVNIVTLGFFKLLENPDVARNDELRDDIFDFLGYSLKAHNTNLGYSVKIIQLVQDTQHLPTCLAKGVHLFVTKYKARNFVMDLFREVDCLDSDDMLRDTTRMHNLSQFLVEMTELCIDLVIEAIDIFLPNLEEESHILRNCVITIIGEVIVKLSTCSELTEEVLKQKEKLTNILLLHVLDVNSFVRCKVIQVAKNLVQEGAMALSVQLQFVERISGRLKDKTCIVRKNALQFLKTFILSNPFAAQVPVEELKNSYEKESKKLAEIAPPVEEAPSKKKAVEFNDSDDEENSDGSQEKDSTVEIPESQSEESTQPVVNGDIDEMDIEVDSNANKIHEEQTTSVEDEEVAKLRVLVEYLKLTLKSGELIIASIPMVCTLLKSATVTDVMEAIDFTSVAFQLGLREAVAGIKEMMRLIFSKEPVVKNAVVAAYKKLYLTTDEEGEYGASLVAKNLMLFLRGATESEAMAIEEFIKEFVKSGDITKTIIKVLWDTFKMALPGVTEEESLASLALLSMVASAEPTIVMRNLSTLMDYGLGERAQKNYEYVKLTCCIFMKIENDCKFEAFLDSKVPQFRLTPRHPLFVRLIHLLTTGVFNHEGDEWCPMAQRVVALMFKLLQFPEGISLYILHRCACLILNYQATDDWDPKKMRQIICRFIYLSGDMILQLVKHVEGDFFMELKRRENQNSKGKKNETKKWSTGRLRRITFEKNKNETQNEEHGVEAEDEALKTIHLIANEELLDEENMFGVLFKMTKFSCLVTMKDFDVEIARVASLSLAKFMTVNEVVCADNMQVLITLMEKSPDEIIRSNTVISMGDLMLRFPNEVEPWSMSLYKMLKDESPIVRLNTLVVLNQLILHDMIKVKGQISDIAICMIDEDEELVTVAKYLFKELSKKKNTLYNLLPDIISGLADDTNEVDEEVFQTIIKYIFQFIEKEREVEGLVEKLCIRLKDIQSPSQLHKIVFSLSLFPMNEKCFKKFTEHKDCFKGKSDEKFAKFMKDILNNCKKLNPKLEQEIVAFSDEFGFS